MTIPDLQFSGAAAALEEDWPTFGWIEDVRPALRAALDAGRSVALATLYRVEASAPREAGVQMLFDGARSVGYFSGGCVEADVSQHAALVVADGKPRRLHYGVGSPWRDIKLRCGGAIHVFVERIDSASAVARDLLARGVAREPVVWISDGAASHIEAATSATQFLTTAEQPLTIARRYDPTWRLIVSGWDPTALAIARLGVEAQLETYLVRPDGPEAPPEIAGLHYLRSTPALGIDKVGVDAWTAFVGATHESELDIPACAAALIAGAGYVGLVGAASRVPERTRAIIAAGAPEHTLARLHAPAGVPNLGKAPWRIAVGIVAEVLETMNRHRAGG